MPYVMANGRNGGVDSHNLYNLIYKLWVLVTNYQELRSNEDSIFSSYVVLTGNITISTYSMSVSSCAEAHNTTSNRIGAYVLYQKKKVTKA